MSLMSRIAKKIRRRFRKKGTFWDNPKPRMTEAEKLIANNWNIPFSNPDAPALGRERAMERFLAKKQANAKTKHPKREPTRQVFRALARRAEKDHRMLGTAKYTRKHG